MKRIILFSLVVMVLIVVGCEEQAEEDFYGPEFIPLDEFEEEIVEKDNDGEEEIIEIEAIEIPDPGLDYYVEDYMFIIPMNLWREMRQHSNGLDIYEGVFPVEGIDVIYELSEEEIDCILGYGRAVTSQWGVGVYDIRKINDKLLDKTATQIDCENKCWYELIEEGYKKGYTTWGKEEKKYSTAKYCW